jgi:hypothetical protein
MAHSEFKKKQKLRLEEEKEVGEGMAMQFPWKLSVILLQQ